jgi:hypothetical protein
MYKFEKGIVDITANLNPWSTESEFLLIFKSKNHNGWNITKEITKSEVVAMTEATATDFYHTALNYLGIGETV